MIAVSRLKVFGNSQHGFTDGKFCLISLTASLDSEMPRQGENKGCSFTLAISKFSRLLQHYWSQSGGSQTLWVNQKGSKKLAGPPGLKI